MANLLGNDWLQVNRVGDRVGVRETDCNKCIIEVLNLIYIFKFKVK